MTDYLPFDILDAIQKPEPLPQVVPIPQTVNNDEPKMIVTTIGINEFRIMVTLCGIDGLKIMK